MFRGELSVFLRFLCTISGVLKSRLFPELRSSLIKFLYDRISMDESYGNGSASFYFIISAHKENLLPLNGKLELIS